MTVQTDVVELLLRAAKYERLPAHCTAGLPEDVRAACCTSLPMCLPDSIDACLYQYTGSLVCVDMDIYNHHFDTRSFCATE